MTGTLTAERPVNGLAVQVNQRCESRPVPARSQGVFLFLLIALLSLASISQAQYANPYYRQYWPPYTYGYGRGYGYYQQPSAFYGTATTYHNPLTGSSTTYYDFYPTFYRAYTPNNYCYPHQSIIPQGWIEQTP